jgi:hypothetical protein
MREATMADETPRDRMPSWWHQQWCTAICKEIDKLKSPGVSSIVISFDAQSVDETTTQYVGYASTAERLQNIIILRRILAELEGN